MSDFFSRSIHSESSCSSRRLLIHVSTIRPGAASAASSSSIDGRRLVQLASTSLGAATATALNGRRLVDVATARVAATAATRRAATRRAPASATGSTNLQSAIYMNKQMKKLHQLCAYILPADATLADTELAFHRHPRMKRLSTESASVGQLTYESGHRHGVAFDKGQLRPSGLAPVALIHANGRWKLSVVNIEPSHRSSRLRIYKKGGENLQAFLKNHRNYVARCQQKHHNQTAQCRHLGFHTCCLCEQTTISRGATDQQRFLQPP